MSTPIPGCTGKRGYPSYDAARTMREQRQAKGARQLRIYRCSFCRMWHLTSYADQRDRATGERRVAEYRRGKGTA